MFAVAGVVFIFLASFLGRVSSTVVLITSTNESLPFPDMEATFGKGFLILRYRRKPVLIPNC
ncbi:hypothetical protein O6H91_Y445700 [Diphasiastrum complanatum]|nr:hypothetical protein O6H91_Y445700 [Diphasiastrum complanatum]